MYVHVHTIHIHYVHNTHVRMYMSTPYTCIVHYVCIYTCMCMSTPYTCTLCLHIHMSAHTHVRTYTCTCQSIHTHVHTCTHTPLLHTPAVYTYLYHAIGKPGEGPLSFAQRTARPHFQSLCIGIQSGNGNLHVLCTPCQPWRGGWGRGGVCGVRGVDGGVVEELERWGA